MTSADNDPTPFDVINIFIEVGNNLKIQTDQVEDSVLIEQLKDRMPLETLKTSHVTLNEYQNAIDKIEIKPSEYYKIGMINGKIGLHLTLFDYDKFRRAYSIYQTYRDPRIRNADILRGESITEAILKEAKMESIQGNTKMVEMPLRSIRMPAGISPKTIHDFPKLEWVRNEDDISITSHMLLLTLIAILKQGWMVNPELIRLLNLVKSSSLDDILDQMSIFVKSRIVVSLQRLADILYLTNFGILDETIHFHLIEDMFENPLENRTNLPQSEASDVINFLNLIRENFEEIDSLTILSRKIGFLTKPISNETTNFIGLDTAGDAIREILSVIHYAMENQDIDTQIKTIRDMVLEPDFLEISKYYFDPSYELLHTPLVTVIQATIERLKVHVLSKINLDTFSELDIHNLQERLGQMIGYLKDSPTSGQFIEIWQKINNFVKINVDELVKDRSKREIYQLIKGKTVLLNIMTPLLLAKYEGRGFNPLAANVDESLESHLKSITGVIALGSNLKSKELIDLLDTIFKVAPEKKQEKPKSSVPDVPSAKGLPKPAGSGTSDGGSQLIPTKMGVGLARLANEYVTGGGERNLHRALVELIRFTENEENIN